MDLSSFGFVGIEKITSVYIFADWQSKLIDQSVCQNA